ncbi:MAG: lipoate--protein ligase [Oscillospiraceae bacterium]|nr:lipoate--protein ligase [Oscillospiraceae bacterium]
MISKIAVFEATGTDPHYNIATEKYLLQHVEKNQCILYLWQNKNTVVIGRNQNAWAECRTTLLEEEGGKLARRLSGGGAVFHDLGNLNFTFLMCDEDYDLDRQFEVIRVACQNIGIPVEKSGRNDLLADGKKFSGNAFYHSQGHAYHHGTLLVNADMDKLSRYLTPPKAKLEAKGVSSVRSRVTNLKDLCPELTIPMLREQMRQAFETVYGLSSETISLSGDAIAEIEKSKLELSDWQWCYGPRLPFSFTCEERFSWGSITLQLQVEGGYITTANVYSDAMEWDLAETVSDALTGCRFTTLDMQKVLKSMMQNTPACKDICQMLEKQEL